MQVIQIQALVDRSVIKRSLFNTEAQFERHKRIGPAHKYVVKFPAGLPSNSQNVFESFSREKCDTRALSFEQGIGCDGRAVNDFSRFQSVQSLENRGFRLTRCGEFLE